MKTRIITDNDGYPVRVYKLVEVGRFRSIHAAAKHVKAAFECVRRAVNNGTPLNELHFRYADMPIECQPLRTLRRRRIPVVWEGKVYPSILAASGGDHAKYMKISRTAKRVNAHDFD